MQRRSHLGCCCPSLAAAVLPVRSAVDTGRAPLLTGVECVRATTHHTPPPPPPRQAFHAVVRLGVLGASATWLSYARFGGACLTYLFMYRGLAFLAGALPLLCILRPLHFACACGSRD